MASFAPPTLLRKSSDISFESIVANTSDIIIVTTADLESPGPVMLYVNPAFTRLTGFTASEAIGQSPRILQGPGTSRATLNAIHTGLAAGIEVRETVLNYSKTGTPYWLDMRITPMRDAQGRIIGFAAIERDVTLDRARASEPPELSERDSITGFANNKALLRWIEEAPQPRPALGLQPCLAYIDIDNFRSVVKQIGPDQANLLLFWLAERLNINLRRIDRICHLTHDKFAVWMPAITVSDATIIAGRLCKTIAATPFSCPAGNISLSISICVLPVTTPQLSPNQILLNAEQAMYLAKKGGSSRVTLSQQPSWP